MKVLFPLSSRVVRSRAASSRSFSLDGRAGDRRTRASDGAHKVGHGSAAGRWFENCGAYAKSWVAMAGSMRASLVFVSFLVMSSGVLRVARSEAAEEPATVDESVPSDVLVLDITNFAETVKKHDFILVEFYAPWCGHCKRLAPEYETAATALKSHDPPIVLAKVDVNEEENKPLAAEYDVKGFPTLKVLRNKGEIVVDYKGPREAEGIVTYLKKLVGPPSVELTSADQAEQLLEEHKKEVTIVGVFKALESDEYANFMKVADALRTEYIFAHTVEAAYVPDNGVPLKTPSVRLYKDFDDKISDFSDFSVEALSDFIGMESLPLVVEMSKKPEHRPALVKFFDTSKDKVFLFLGSSEAAEEGAEDSAATLAAFTATAKSFREKGLIFMFSEQSESANALEYFGVSASDLPAYVIQTVKSKKFIADNVNSERLPKWINDYLGGKLKEHIKSDPIPLTNDEPVKVIVAESIKEAVLESGKNVLLEFYAPWCGHCKKLAPILDEVALSFESDPDVMIAKFDATTNDVPDDLFDVKGFPTIYFYSAEKVMTLFEGDRTKEGIVEFINASRSRTSKHDDAEEIEPEILIQPVFDSKDEL